MFFSSNLGNESNHSTKNLPVIVTGGGYNHGKHLAFNLESLTPLLNLFVSMLQRSGINFEKFGTSTARLIGHDFAN